MKKEEKYWIFGIGIFILIILAFWGYYNFIFPNIHVWQEKMRGEAELAHADANRKIAICEAMAKKESAKSLSEAEIIRAHGVAEANKIIGDSLRENEGYLRYLWIQSLDHGQSTVVYVPTEANLPILESKRLKEDLNIHINK